MKRSKGKTLCFMLCPPPLLPLDCIWSISTPPLELQTHSILQRTLDVVKIRQHFISKLCFIWFVLINVMNARLLFRRLAVYLLRVWWTCELITALHNDNTADAIREGCKKIKGLLRFLWAKKGGKMPKRALVGLSRSKGLLKWTFFIAYLPYTSKGVFA